MSDFNEPQEYRRPDSINLALFTPRTPLDQLVLLRIQHAPQLRHERAIERIHGASGTGGCAVQHARELVACLEDVECRRMTVLRVAGEEDFSQGGHLLG